MRMKALAVAASLAFAAGSAGAATITNVSGTLPFSGFDWAQGGTAYTQGFDPLTPGSTFDLQYFAVATALVTGGFNYVPSANGGMDIIPDGAPGPTPLTGTAYDYTIVATLHETVVSCGATSCTFNVSGGDFSIYYDTTSAANATAGSLGTGFTTGTLIIQGTVNPLTGQSFDTVSGSNSTTLQGVVTLTNPLIDPTLLGTTFTSTLQIGQAQTSYTDPGGFGGTAWHGAGGLLGANDLTFQADGNQSFTTVPEPASLALLGLGLAAMGWNVRRKRGQA